MKRLAGYSPRIAIAAAMAVAVALVFPVVVRAIASFHIYMTSENLPKAQAALVLGASVVAGQPSPVLAERADTAIALYKAGTVKKILVSGDNGENNYDEVTVIFKYLTSKGVPAYDIFLDRAGFDTYSSMYRARYVFGARSLIIPTQDFHLPRAVFLARAMGIDANGLLAGSGGSAWDYLREIPATIKAVFDLILHREPKYLGAPVPMVGRGNAG